MDREVDSKMGYGKTNNVFTGREPIEPKSTKHEQYVY
jgi:hypothetical protein